MRLFNAFKENSELIRQTEYVNIYSVKCVNKDYTIVIPKKAANKHTIIYFIDDTVYWEQIPRFYRLVGKQYRDKISIYKFDKRVLNTIFVVKGTPLGDVGLDNGIFRSHKRYDENFVNCMTYKKFKSM